MSGMSNGKMEGTVLVFQLKQAKSLICDDDDNDGDDNDRNDFTSCMTPSKKLVA
jgi:hypothetical protein